MRSKKNQYDFLELSDNLFSSTKNYHDFDKASRSAAVSLGYETLQDCSSSGRRIDWSGRKMANSYLAEAYDTFDPRKADRLRECANRLVFGVNPDGTKKLVSAQFCRVRLCPICQWRRSLKLFSQMTELMAYMKPMDYRFIFLTLTIRNVPMSGLSGAIDQLCNGFGRYVKYDRIKLIAKGWYRGLEVTHNLDRSSDWFDTYHPHLHVLIAVNRSYFNSRDYLKFEEWQRLWQRAAKIDYDVQVDVRTVKGDSPRAVCELTKYTAKSRDFIVLDDWQLTVDTVRGLDRALHGRRLVGFGGVMRDCRRKLAQEDVETGDLIHVDGDDPAEQYDYYASYGWHTGFCQYLRGEDI